jgi:hypothetical protein
MDGTLVQVMRLCAILGLVLVGLSACASVGRYGRNRALDAADIVTVGVERRVYGFAASAGPLTLGMSRQSAGQGLGVRAGTIGSYATGAASSEILEPRGDSSLLLNSAYHAGLSGCRSGAAKKAYEYRNALGLWLFAFEGYNGLFQFEASVGLYAGVRVGFNVAEALDFLLGLAAIDLLGDDNWCDDVTQVSPHTALAPAQ